MKRYIRSSEDTAYNRHLVHLSKEDKQYVLNRLNKSHKTLGMGVAGDPGYYVSEFEPAYGLYLWVSDAGMRILDDNDIEYEEVKKAVASSTIKANSNQEFEYQLLDRLRSDCDYVLNTYYRPDMQENISREERKLNQRVLWASNAKDQIAKMKELYRKLKVKPEWITLEDIAEYERKFKEILGKDYRGAHEYVGASTDFTVDMWYGDKFMPKKYGADAWFSDADCVYRGNIYDDNGKAIGDYTADDSTIIEKNFNISWGE